MERATQLQHQVSPEGEGEGEGLNEGSTRLQHQGDALHTPSLTTTLRRRIAVPGPRWCWPAKVRGGFGKVEVFERLESGLVENSSRG